MFGTRTGEGVFSGQATMVSRWHSFCECFILPSIHQFSANASPITLQLIMKYIGALDVGSTTIRCHIYDETAAVVGSAKDTMTLLYPYPRWVEMDPEEVWLKVKSVVTAAFKDAKLTSERITCLGISCQRGSTLTWQKSTGKPLHNFICWQDMRADELMQSSNHSALIRSIRFAGNIAYFLTGNKFMLAAGTHQLYQGQPSLFLIWALKNIEPLQKAVKAQDAAFGTLSSWLLYKLSNKTVHVADASTLSTTGLFDTFAMKYSAALLWTYGIPEHILPRIVDTTGLICETREFGATIPITACIADVSASMFGSKCFEKGDLNIILGTGTFANLNTGSEIFLSRSGAYPTVAWQMKDHVTYTMEALCHNTGPVMKSAIKMGLIDSVEKSAALAYSVSDTDGVMYVPAFSGLPVPINDLKAAVGMIGVKVTTTGRHVLRAMLESIAFRVRQILQVIQTDTDIEIKTTRVSGGVSNNDLIIQTLATLTDQVTVRPSDVETSALGAAYLAGIGAGVWKNQESLPKSNASVDMFVPYGEDPEIHSRYTTWESALRRFQNWYNTN